MSEGKNARHDLRYLGRLLGDVIREQDGVEVFDRIEGARAASVAAHRSPSDEASFAASCLASPPPPRSGGGLRCTKKGAVVAAPFSLSVRIGPIRI